MTVPPWLSESIRFCVRFVGKTVGGSAAVVRTSIVASCSVAETLLDLIGSGLAHDVGQVKDAMIRKFEAEANSAEADALKKLAEAADAANRANLHKRKDRAAKLELEKQRLVLAKSDAERRAIESDTENRRIQAISDAQAKLLDAMAKLNQQGGSVFFDKQNLQEILQGKLIAGTTEPKNDVSPAR
jgi:hypothetical protein